MKVTALAGDQSLERRARRGRESRCKLAVLFATVIGGCSKHRGWVVGQRIVRGRNVCVRAIAEIKLRLHASPMRFGAPTAHLLLTRALALLVIAIVTAGMLAADWIGPARFPMVLPIIVAYFVFNFGFVFIIKAGCLTRATRLGSVAVLLNFFAMFLSGFELAWRLASIAACAASLVAAVMLLGEARATTA